MTINASKVPQNFTPQITQNVVIKDDHVEITSTEVRKVDKEQYLKSLQARKDILQKQMDAANAEIAKIGS